MPKTKWNGKKNMMTNNISREFCQEYASGDKDFEDWLFRLDTIVQNYFGLSLFDLEDMLFRDVFDGGNTPWEFFSQEIKPKIIERL